MAVYTQETRRLILETPLGNDALIAANLTGSEEISRLFQFQMDLISEQSTIDPKKIIGQTVTLNLPLPSGIPRYFNGYVTRFSRQGSDDRFTHYRAEIHPWLWFLTRTTDCRIFQNQSVPDIIKQVLADHHFAVYEISQIINPHPQREYCVQYRESDFAFLSRLMEEEGIFYYFRHEHGKHTMVIGDQNHAFVDADESHVNLFTNANALDSTDHITSWDHRYQFRSGRWAHNDYNFKTPSNPLMATTKTLSRFDGVEQFELYDYPGRHAAQADGDSLAKLRIEEEEVGCDVVSASSLCRSFSPGKKFTVLAPHVADEDAKEYVITRIEHQVSTSGSYASGGDSARLDYTNHFDAIPATVQYRAARLTPRPTVYGTQTAVVVGPAGQEIHTDAYSRIKVQFYWDRRGKKNDNSSCWIRTAQLASGGGFGLFAVPRVGHEVVVSFLEGDPDRPLVMGSVYNAQNMPPVSHAGRKAQDGPVPTDAIGAKMQTTLRSNSLGGSGGHNEITMNDTGGSEGLFFKAQKDETHNVGNNRTDTVAIDEARTVGNNQTVAVTNNQSITIGNNRTDSVGSNEDLKVGANKTENIGANASEIVGAAKVVQVGSTLMLQAATSITLQCGASTLHMNQAGMITLTGMMITVAGGIDINIAAPIVNVAGGMLLTNSAGLLNVQSGGVAMVDASGGFHKVIAGGVASVSGAEVQINGTAKTGVNGGVTSIVGGPVKIN